MFYNFQDCIYDENEFEHQMITIVDLEIIDQRRPRGAFD